MRAPIRGIEIFFDINGFGLLADGAVMRERPTAFVVHGGPGVDHSNLKMRYGWLTEHVQVVYFDHRGHGRSSRADPRTYTLDENVEDMEALRAYLGVSKIMTIGTSYGASIAMAHAARYSDAVSHLVLIAGAAHGGYAERARMLVRQRGSPEQIEQCEALFEGRLTSPEKMRRFFEIMQTLYSCSNTSPADVAAALNRAVYTPEALNNAHGPAGFQRTGDLRPVLASIRAPTLIVAGLHDWICPPEFAEEMHRLIAGSVLHVFEDSGHSVGADVPRQLELVFREFIQRSSGQGASKQYREPTP